MGIVRSLIRKVTRPVRVKTQGEAGEAQVDSTLNPLFFGKVEHRQINNLILMDENGRSLQIDHVEIRENGIFVIETKNFSGYLYGDEHGENWTQVLNARTKRKILNPIKQNRSHCYHVKKVLGPNYHVNSLVVLVQNNATKIDCPNVVNLKDLKNYLKTFDDGTHLSKEDMDLVYQQLKAYASNISNKEHVENIKETHRDVVRNICPRCGGKLVLRKGNNGNFYGCSNYPKCKFTKKT